MNMLRTRVAMIGALLCLELVALAVAYQFFASIECQATDAESACRLLRSLVARAIAIFAAFVIMAWTRPDAVAWLARRVEANSGVQSWVLLHLAGMAMLFAPLVIAQGRDLGGLFALFFAPWLIGAVLASVGALFWLAPPEDWLAWLRAERFVPLLVIAAAFAIPDVADLALPFWESPALTQVTFAAVHHALSAFSAAPISNPGGYNIGMDGFVVHIASACSGVEGFALVTGFTLLYGILFRDQTRFPLFWIVMIPLGLVLSWAFNVLRISALIWIGARISPLLAVNGFHSYAGWMFFTLLALAMLYIAQAVPVLRKADNGRPAEPLREDWTAARILPFVAFMLASVVTSSFWTQPDLAYPLKVLAMTAAIGFFLASYRRIEWSLDPVAVAAGALVGLLWIALRPPAGPEDQELGAALAQLGTVSFMLWATMRLLGTVILVPFVEELFFRGYVLARLDRGGPFARVGAIVLSTALFAALHGRWIAAGCAGLVFAFTMLRRGRLSDAIVAHATSNLVIALWAMTQDDWTAI